MRSAIRRTALTLVQLPFAQRHNPRGVECLTCHTLVDREEICDDQPIDFDGPTQKQTFCRFRFRCHGQDEVLTVDMGGVEWRIEDACAKVRKIGAFDPTQHLEAALRGMSDVSREDERPERGDKKT